MEMYTIRSVSEDGVYYLVNGWRKHKAFWSKTADPVRNGFKTDGLAERQLDKLLATMPEYGKDKLTLVMFDLENRKLVPVREYGIVKPFWEW